MQCSLKLAVSLCNLSRLKGSNLGRKALVFSCQAQGSGALPANAMPFTEALVVGDTSRIAIINNNRPASHNSASSRPVHSSMTPFSLVNSSCFLVSRHQLPSMLFSQI